MTLREQRVLFSRLISELVLWVNQQPGYACAYDQVKRTAAEAAANAKKGTGIARSLHTDGLAADLLLYRDGIYQEFSEAHAFIGARWKQMHSLARWGGDFKDARGRPKPDGNHYSLERDGVK